MKPLSTVQHSTLLTFCALRYELSADERLATAQFVVVRASSLPHMAHLLHLLHTGTSAPCGCGASQSATAWQCGSDPVVGWKDKAAGRVPVMAAGSFGDSVEEMAEMKVLDEELSHEDDYEVVMRMRREAVVDRANSRGLHTKADE